MDWMLVIYLALGGSSLLLLIIMMVFGNLDLDVDAAPDLDIDAGPDIDIDVGDVDGGPGILSLPVLLSFFAAFGGLGALLTYFDVNNILTPFVAAGAALVFAGLLFLMVRYFFRMFSSDSTVKYGTLVGKKANVSVTINPGMEGQVNLFTEQRGRTLIPATSKKKFPSGSTVVIASANGDTVSVISPAAWGKMSNDDKRKLKLKERRKKLK